MKTYVILHQGSRAATVRLPETPSIGSIVRTPSYFSYRVRKEAEYRDGQEEIYLHGDRVFV